MIGLHIGGSTMKGNYSRLKVGMICKVKNKYYSIPKNQLVEVLDNRKIGSNHKIRVIVLNGTNREVMIPTDYLN